jgi:two-component system response regulator (stage 0 sporulation protein F)
MDDRKVLIVDDQNGIRVMLSELLHSEGYSIYQASNGRIALELVQQYQPDLVLLDMKIPGMSGLEILRQIKQQHPEIKVIMMTAYGELNMLNEARDLGALMNFSKPFDIDELRLAVNTELGDAFTL